MSFSEGSAETVPLKPCTACRKRKVRCDKLRPSCSTCLRSNQSCVYEGADNNGGGLKEDTNTLTGDAELRDRLARLEQMMAVMIVREKEGPVSGTQTLNAPNETLNDLTISSTQNQRPSLTPIVSSSTTSPVGHIVFQEGEGAYFATDFWLGLISEIEDLRRIFDTPSEQDASSQWASSALLGVPSIFSSTDLALTHPPHDESNVMLKLFFQSVNPFIRVLHQSLFARELDQYRRGTFVWPKEFEALLFSVYLVTINSLRPSVVEQVFSKSKDTILARYQYAAQVSLTKMNFFKTQKIPGIWAILHYITFLFQQNMYKDAMALLGTAVRQAQAMGLHRDPTHFPFSPWVCELRRRIWNHLCNLDALAIDSFGAESCLPATSDSRPPRNANDSDWHASRFANPSSVPSDLKGFKDMSYVLAQREVSDTTRALAKLDSNDFQTKQDILTRSEIRLAECLQGMERDDPSHTVVKAVIDIRFSNLRLAMKHQQSKDCKSQLPNPGIKRLFISALEILEAHESHASAFTSLNWEWTFETSIPWLAIAILITELPIASSQEESDRAQTQIDRIFTVYGSAPISKMAMWKILAQLRHRSQEDASTMTGAAIYVPATDAFADDFMLDLGDITFNEQLMIQDMEELPW